MITCKILKSAMTIGTHLTCLHLGAYTPTDSTRLTCRSWDSEISVKSRSSNPAKCPRTTYFFSSSCIRTKWKPYVLSLSLLHVYDKGNVLLASSPDLAWDIATLVFVPRKLTDGRKEATSPQMESSEVVCKDEIPNLIDYAYKQI